MSAEPDRPQTFSAALASALADALGPDALLLERSDLERYERGWRYGAGRAAAVVRPRTPEAVATVLRLANEHRVRVHPIGANTGLVGASNPDASGEELVLSFERLNAVIDVDPIDRTVVCDAGVTLSQLEAALAPHGLTFPIDLGADPQVGGMVVTNTGGARLIKHGDVRRRVLGVQVALADGTLVDGCKRLRKDNTGLSLHQLFVGTSGAYGCVTRAVLDVAPLPRQRASALVAASTGDALLALCAHLERTGGDTLTAFEVIGRDALAITLERGANLRDPFRGERPAFTALIELSTTLAPERLELEELLQEELAAFCEEHPRGEELIDLLVGRGDDFWAIRHQISESLAQQAQGGRVLALDLALPRAQLAAFSAAGRELVAELAPGARVCDFGHWGDGGTHFNVLFPPATPEATLRAVQTRLYDLCVLTFGGSYSAEHGIGPHNAEHWLRYTPAAVQSAHAALQIAFGRPPAGSR